MHEAHAAYGTHEVAAEEGEFGCGVVPAECLHEV